MCTKNITIYVFVFHLSNNSSRWCHDNNSFLFFYLNLSTWQWQVLVLYKIPIRKTIGGNTNVATVLHSSNWRKIEISTRKRLIRAMPLLKKKYKNPYRLTLSTNILYHYSSLFYRYRLGFFPSIIWIFSSSSFLVIILFSLP